ncbi:hypothetical protein [Streptomyces rochei]|uniref:hypothetical protein n=1 Tax=Streptomyces rochei TaxID=1928 RepID=UPI003685B776
MGTYADELSEWDEGWNEGRTEAHDALVNTLGDNVRAGIVTLAAAVTIYSQTVGLPEEVFAAFLCEYWSELMSARWNSLGGMTTE